MITVIGRKELEAAIERPEDYGDLVVRVGGFSEYFVRLDRMDQEDILKRTLY